MATPRWMIYPGHRWAHLFGPATGWDGVARTLCWRWTANEKSVVQWQPVVASSLLCPDCKRVAAANPSG